MQILYFFESIRNPVFDAFFSLITRLGEETAFMAIAIIIFWCVSKSQGYFLLLIGFIGTAINQFLKIIFRVPRPWVKDPNFSVVGNAKEAAGGYSFPSGHTQSAVGLFGGIARANKFKPARITAIVICVLVPISRMYLGVHTFEDVIVSTIISLALVFFGYPLFKKAEEKPLIMYTLLGVFALVVLALLIFVSAYNFPKEVYLPENIHNLESAMKNAYTMLGCAVGVFVVYFVESKYIKFSTKAVWWAQILKVVLGLALVILVKEGLRAPLDYIFNGHLIARSVRYFLIVVVAGVVWPLIFKVVLKKIGDKK